MDIEWMFWTGIILIEWNGFGTEKLKYNGRYHTYVGTLLNSNGMAQNGTFWNGEKYKISFHCI
jgi:hypothetical protein